MGRTDFILKAFFFKGATAYEVEKLTEINDSTDWSSLRIINFGRAHYKTAGQQVTATYKYFQSELPARIIM